MWHLLPPDITPSTTPISHTSITLLSVTTTFVGFTPSITPISSIHPINSSGRVEDIVESDKNISDNINTSHIPPISISDNNIISDEVNINNNEASNGYNIGLVPRARITVPSYYK